MPLVDIRQPRTQGLLFGALLFVLAFCLCYIALRHLLDTTLVHKSDQWGYYQYLPALLGTHEWQHLPYSIPLDDERTLNVFTIGVAWMQAPFFFLSAAVAKITGSVVDGYSRPFVIGQFMASSFYLAAGCALLFHSLRRRFDPAVSITVPLLLFGATNLHYYTVFEPGMSHVYSFFLLSWLLYLTVHMNEVPRGDRLLGLIVCAGLIVLVRHTNAIALLVPLLYGATWREALRERVRWLRRFPFHALIGLLGIASLWLPQLLYWHFATGRWFVLTYGEDGQGFNWGEPHLLDVLFSHQNGWFVYTPLMLFVVAALLVQAWRGAQHARLVLTVLALVWVLYSCWWCWWLGGSFGHRGFIEYYAFLSLPLAMMIDRMMQWRAGAREWAFIAIGLLVFYNIRMCNLYHWPWEGEAWSWSALGDWASKAFFPG